VSWLLAGYDSFLRLTKSIYYLRRQCMIQNHRTSRIDVESKSKTKLAARSTRRMAQIDQWRDSFLMLVTGAINLQRGRSRTKCAELESF